MRYTGSVFVNAVFVFSVYDTYAFRELHFMRVSLNSLIARSILFLLCVARDTKRGLSASVN